MTGLPRPTFVVDPRRALLGRVTKASSLDSFMSAFRRAADLLGCAAVRHPATVDFAGLDPQVVDALFRTAMNAVVERTPGRWTVGASARDLKALSRSLRAQGGAA